MIRYILLLMVSFSLYASNPPVQAIVFDFGKVIGSSKPQKIVTFAANSFGISEEELYKRLRNDPSHIAWQKLVWDGNFWQRVADENGIILTREWQEAYWTTKQETIYAHPGMLSIVNQLKDQGFRVAMLSNVISEKADVIRSLGLYDLFSPALLSCDIGFDKPDAKAFQLLIETLDLPPESVIMVDDHPRNIATANHLGMAGVLFETPTQFRELLINEGLLAE
ncbi:MAG: HAD family phosphatase [Chlamydiia bacterium]|nr:HAD family phosphatase [Chlamydiia bacterium]